MVLGYETSKLLVMQAAMKNEGKRNTRETTGMACDRVRSRRHISRSRCTAPTVLGRVRIEATSATRAPIIYEATQIHKMMQPSTPGTGLNGHTGEMSPLVS